MSALARGPRTAAEAAVWHDLQVVMGFAIRAHRPADWMAVLQALRDPRQGPNTGQCSQPGCDHPAANRGLCGTHYKHQLRARSQALRETR